MSKIEVGDYIRTKIGIGKIVKIFEYDDGHKDYYTDRSIDDEDDSTTLHIHQIKRHSKDIIDLIEVGDYVNGSMVYEILEDGRIHIMTGHLLNNKDIKTILTHEQFTQNAYELEE